MTYAQNTPQFNEAERSFSRKRARGTVTADYVPTEILYHPSFLKQHSKKVVHVILLGSLSLISLVSFGLHDHPSLLSELPRMLTILDQAEAFIALGMILTILCSPYTAYLCLALPFQYHKHSKMLTIFQGGESPVVGLLGHEVRAPEPLQVTYHRSFLRQYRWHVVTYLVASLLGVGALFMTVSMAWAGTLTFYFWMYAVVSLICVLTSPLMVVWRRRYRTLEAFDSESRAASQATLAHFE